MNRTLGLAVVVAAAICAPTAWLRGADLTLARDGQSAAAIILAEKPVKAAQFAAFELQLHIKAISGATLPILRGVA